MASPKLSFAKSDAQKVAKGGVIAAAGTVLTYLAGLAFPEVNTNAELQGAVFVVSCVIVNATWKFLTDTRTEQLKPG